MHLQPKAFPDGLNNHPCPMHEYLFLLTLTLALEVWVSQFPLSPHKAVAVTVFLFLTSMPLSTR